jgi:CRP-like cAMP-binding protein
MAAKSTSVSNFGPKVAALERALATMATDHESVSSIWPPGVRLCEQGKQTKGVYLVRSGIVTLAHSACEKKNVLVSFCTRGALVGTTSVISRVPEPIRVTTLTECELQYYSAGRFRERMPAERFANSVGILLSHTANAHLQTLIRRSTLSAKALLESVLLELALISGKAIADGTEDVIRLALPMKYRDLASLIGITPEHLSRLLTSLEGEGVLQRKQGWLIFKRFCCTQAHFAAHKTTVTRDSVPSFQRDEQALDVGE